MGNGETMANETIDRANARQNGTRFYRGAPCLIHPEALRYTASKACVECAKAARKANTNREKDAARKRAARKRKGETASATNYAPSWVICDLLGI